MGRDAVMYMMNDRRGVWRAGCRWLRRIAAVGISFLIAVCMRLFIA